MTGQGEPVFGVREAEALGLMPCQIGVFCDRCGETEDHDYWVPEDSTQPERFEIARKTLRGRGWRCDEVGDFCPECLAAMARDGEA